MALGMFEVHAGNFKKGMKHQLTGKRLLMKSDGSFFKENIKLNQIQAVAVATEESVKRFGGTLGWGIAGGFLFGPVGLLAGLLAGGRGKNVTFVCQLKDGRRFLATADSSIFTALSAAAFS